MLEWLGENWGNIASVLGLIVSIVGFAFAIWQLSRTRRAAEAAEQAADAAREGLSKNLTIADLTTVSERIQETRRLLRQAEWERALDTFYGLRVMLSDIRSQHPGLTQDEQQAMRRAADRLSRIEMSVSESVSTGDPPDNVESFDAALLRIQSVLHGLASNLKQSL